MLEIEIIDNNIIEGGIEVFARAWKDGIQIGFGKNGDIDVERFRVFNPPILVDDVNGDIIKEAQTIDKNGEIINTERRLKEDPEEAILQTLERIIEAVGKFDSKNIITGRVGNTTTTVYPDEDRNITSGSPTLNRDLNPQYIQRNSGDSYRSLIDFTFPAGSDSFDSVTVSLVHNSQSGTHTTVDVHEITRSGFNLLACTWNTYDGSNNWTTAGGDFGGVMDSVTPGTGVKTWEVYGGGASNPITPAWGTTFHFLFKYTNDISSPASNWWGHYASEQTGTASDPFITIEHSAGGTDVTVSPSPLTATFSIPTPTVSAEQYAEVSASPLSATFSIPAPVVSTAVTVSPSTLTGTFSIPTPIVEGESPNAEVLASPLTGAFTIASPTITTERNAVVEPSPLSATFSLQAPTVTLGVAVTVSPDPLSAVFSIPAYTVTVISNITITPSPLTGIFSMPSSFVRGDFWQDKFAPASDPFTDKVYNAGDNWEDKF